MALLSATEQRVSGALNESLRKHLKTDLITEPTVLALLCHISPAEYNSAAR